MSTLDYDEGGHVTVTGQATPGTVVRAYINDKMVAEGQAGADGSWRLAPPDPVGVGKHKLRLDRLTKDGKPIARLELPFDRVPVPPGTGDSERLVVVRGDSLWNIELRSVILRDRNYLKSSCLSVLSSRTVSCWYRRSISGGCPAEPPTRRRAVRLVDSRD
jgi:nucleoid-associated protein YgaU